LAVTTLQAKKKGGSVNSYFLVFIFLRAVNSVVLEIIPKYGQQQQW
jgi:hypothetical protein